MRSFAPGMRNGTSSYLDTSFLIPYYLTEDTSEQVQAILRAAPPGTLATSDWTIAEFTSALTRLYREDALDDPRVVGDELLAHTASVYTVLDVKPVAFRSTRDLLLYDPSLNLRGPDALHLAIVRRNDETLYTLDRKLLDCAAALGIPATNAGLLPTVPSH